MMNHMHRLGVQNHQVLAGTGADGPPRRLQKPVGLLLKEGAEGFHQASDKQRTLPIFETIISKTTGRQSVKENQLWAGIHIRLSEQLQFMQHRYFLIAKHHQRTRHAIEEAAEGGLS